MTETVRFTVKGAPHGKARPRVVDGHAFTPRKTVSYEALVVSSYRRAYPGRVRWEKGVPLRMSITAYYPIPASAGHKAQILMASGRMLPTKKPDTDNICKIIADACNGIAYYDDAQIVEMSVRKEYSDDPRVTVEITEIEI